MYCRSLMCCLAVLLLAEATQGLAADTKSAYTNAREAGPEFDLQGEYSGTLKTDEGEKRWGAQVVALGNGKFMGIGYEGGLPGDGWERGEKTYKSTSELKDGAIVFSGDEWNAKVQKGVLTVTDQSGKKLCDLPKIERKSTTLGAPPPAGAKVLFNGKSADHFENGTIVEENLLGATNCVSKKKFGDHSFHIEFRTPFMPAAKGQARGNSGVYIQSRYELQVLDSFGLEGENNECGGIYSISKPLVNMCFPPLSWQTYDIDFKAAKYDANANKTTNARVTIRHNGVVIHDNLELTKGTPGRLPEGPSPEGLFLQEHGNPVAFRNVWVQEK